MRESSPGTAPPMRMYADEQTSDLQPLFAKPRMFIQLYNDARTTVFLQAQLPSMRPEPNGLTATVGTVLDREHLAPSICTGLDLI
jgi:hypothetical protein